MYRFVPEFITDLVEGVCKANDWVCLDIRKEGVYSGYFATISSGDTTVEKFLPYDYGQTVLPTERPALLASELLTVLPAKQEAAPPADDEQTDKPRKRRKTE